MNKEKLLKISFFLCFSGFLVCPVQSFALDYPSYGKVTGDNVNIRADSTTGAAVLGTADYGEILRLNKGKYSWYKVTLPARLSCFVSSRYLRRTEGKKAMITASSLNMRRAPSLQSEIIGKIPGGAEVRVIRKHGEWTEISPFPYAYGWVHNKFIVPLLPSEIAKLPAHLKEMPEKPVSTVIPAPVTIEPEPVVIPVIIEEKPEPVIIEEKPLPEKEKPEVKTVKPAEIKKPDMPDTPPLARGQLSRLKHKSFGCPANYMLKSSTGFILLKIKPSLKAKALLDRNVSIWGKVKNSSCVYIDVKTIVPH